MAIKQIYGPYQTAGVPVVGTGKSNPKSDGTTPLAQLVALTSGDGVALVDVPGGLTTGVGTLAVETVPSGVAPVAIAPAPTAALASSKVFKASAGNLFSLNVAATTVSGFALLFDAASLPANGAVTPVRAWAINAGQTIDLSFDPPLRLGTGITVGFSSTATTPFTLAASATAFISGEFI